MSLIKISENDDFVVDYDKERGMYRLSVFEDNHFKDEYWFDAYEERELREKDVAMPIKRLGDVYPLEDGWGWWAGRCPRCNAILSFNYVRDNIKGNRKHYCLHCGQLVDFEWDLKD